MKQQDLDTHNHADSAGRRPRLRRLVAQFAVIALLVGGTIALTAISASADSPNPGTNNPGTAVINSDGTITVTVHGSWVWDTKDCPSGNKVPGWAVNWGDNTANALASIFVGDANDNLVHTDATVTCTDDGDTVHGDFAGTITHTYAAGSEIHACVVTYHVDPSLTGEENTGDHSTIAGGTDHNGDNSIEKNHDAVNDTTCAPVTFAPDVAVVKTGPTSAVVGQQFTYDITASNTGVVAADNVTITDQIPANVTFVSATDPCTFDSGTATVTCDVGTLAVGGSATVHITVVPTAAAEGASITNTAVVTPDDETPADNTSTWVIGNVTVLPAVVTPAPVTPAAAVAAAPVFTG